MLQQILSSRWGPQEQGKAFLPHAATCEPSWRQVCTPTPSPAQGLRKGLSKREGALLMWPRGLGCSLGC